jgi:hypothetical protein
MQKTIVGNIVSVGGVKICRTCGRPFRFMSINTEPPVLIEAVDQTLGIRAVQHDCSASESDVKALRSTISHCKQLIGRAFRCHYCRSGVRRVYLFTEDVSVTVNDPGLTEDELMSYTGPLVAHECPRRDPE